MAEAAGGKALPDSDPKRKYSDGIVPPARVRP